MYTVIIRKNSTGEVRRCEEPPDWDESEDYQWVEGNYSCDCNRGLYFKWAAGEDTSVSDRKCGNTEYSCWVKLPDGTVISLDDDAEEGGPPETTANPPAEEGK